MMGQRRACIPSWRIGISIVLVLTYQEKHRFPIILGK
jgi:hypothetical protein